MKNMISGAALIGTVLLAGCASSKTEAVMGLDAARAKTVALGEVVVTDQTGGNNASLVETMTTAIREKVSKCATGTSPTRFEVTVTELKGQNGAMTMLLASSSRARGKVKMIDMSSGATIGDYDLTHSKGGAGLIGVIALSGAEKNMSNAFGDQICTVVQAKTKAQKAKG